MIGRRVRRHWLPLLGLALIARPATAALIPRLTYTDTDCFATAAVWMARGASFSEAFIWNYLDQPRNASSRIALLDVAAWRGQGFPHVLLYRARLRGRARCSCADDSEVLDRLGTQHMSTTESLGCVYALSRLEGHS